MKSIIFAGMLSGMLASQALALSEMSTLVQYECEASSCTATCVGPNTNLTLNYKQATVFQWTDHPRRLWVALADGHHVLGDDVTCRFEGKPTFKFGTSPLPPVHPPCICIDNVCTPPGCGIQ